FATSSACSGVMQRALDWGGMTLPFITMLCVTVHCPASIRLSAAAETGSVVSEQSRMSQSLCIRRSLGKMLLLVCGGGDRDAGWPAPRSPMGARGGGDGGIRPLDRPLQAYNGLANRRLQPLGHVSNGADMPEARVSRKRPVWAR